MFGGRWSRRISQGVRNRFSEGLIQCVQEYEVQYTTTHSFESRERMGSPFCTNELSPVYAQTSQSVQGWGSLPTKFHPDSKHQREREGRVNLPPMTSVLLLSQHTAHRAGSSEQWTQSLKAIVLLSHSLCLCGFHLLLLCSAVEASSGR